MGRWDPGEGGGVESTLRRWQGELKGKHENNMTYAFLQKGSPPTVCWQ